MGRRKSGGGWRDWVEDVACMLCLADVVELLPNTVA